MSFQNQFNSTTFGVIVRTVQPDALVYQTGPLQNPQETVVMAPSGRLIAVGVTGSPDSTRIFHDGVLVNAVDGMGVVWLDDNRLLVTVTVMDSVSTYHIEAHIYDATGALLSSPPLPMMGNVTVVGTDRIYSTFHNAIFQIATGAKVWSGAFPANLGGQSRDFQPTKGVVAGGYAAYASGHEIIAEAY